MAVLAAFVAQHMAPADEADTAAVGGDSNWPRSDAGGSSAVEAAAAGGSGNGMSWERVLAGVRAAVADAIGASIGDDEPLMEVMKAWPESLHSTLDIACTAEQSCQIDAA